jgi:gas vesicle protein
MGGTLTNPTIKTELKQVAGDAVKEMQKQAVVFAKAKADTVKRTVKDTLSSVKTQVVSDVKSDIKNRLLGTKDSSNTNNIDSTKNKAGQTVKNTLNSLFNKKKKPATDTTKKQ